MFHWIKKNRKVGLFVDSTIPTAAAAFIINNYFILFNNARTVRTHLILLVPTYQFVLLVFNLINI
jgi:hypothetical protein